MEQLRPASRDAAIYPSVDEVLQEYEGNVADSATTEESYGQYAWERDIERSWDMRVESSEAFSEVVGGSEDGEERPGAALARGSSGTAISISADGSQMRNSATGEGHIKKGLLRSVVLVIDMSEATREKDYRPDRLTCLCQAAEEFINAFLLRNSLAQFALVGLVGPSAEVMPISTWQPSAEESSAAVSTAAATSGRHQQQHAVGSSIVTSTTQYFSSSAAECIAAIKDKKRRAASALLGSGAPSLRNALLMAKNLLSLVPPYCTRELLVLYGSLRTCDVGNIEELLYDLKKAHISCSVISLAAELYVLKRLCQETGGRHSVPLHREHLRSLLQRHTHTPPWTRRMQPCLIRMGFPSFKITSTAALCSCHQKLTYASYTCPQCCAKLCSVPSRCRCCFLHLVSPADISRAFHNLCPPPSFQPLPRDLPVNSRFCDCCSVEIERGGSQCPECLHIFCTECDLYSHQQLRQCGFCVVEDITGLDVGKGAPAT